MLVDKVIYNGENDVKYHIAINNFR